MFPFDVILFDVGEVLLTNGWDHGARAEVVENFHLDRAVFEARHLKPYYAWARGTISADAYLDAAVFYEPRDFYHDEFFAAMCAQSRPLADGALGILREVVAPDKCLVGALNNEPRETNEYRFDCFGLRELFQVSLSSCYLGVCKPEPAIYRMALDLLGRPAERILLIDDRPENVVGAQAAGMKAIQFTGEDALRCELERLEVL